MGAKPLTLCDGTRNVPGTGTRFGPGQGLGPGPGTEPRTGQGREIRKKDRKIALMIFFFNFQ